MKLKKIVRRQNAILTKLPLGRAALSAGLLALLSIAIGCGKPPAEKEPVVAVQVAPAKQAAIAQTISSDAVVVALQQAVITPKITSVIHQFYVDRGSRVHKGQVLVELENSDLAAAAEQSLGEFQQAEASYATTTAATIPQQLQKAELDAAAAKSAFEAQQKVYDSRKELFQKGAVPRRDLDSAEVALAQAKSQYEVAQRQLEDLKRMGQEAAVKTAAGQLTAAKGKRDAAQAQLGYSKIHSPIDGVVADRPQHVGELATANVPLITVLDPTKIVAKTHVAQADAAALKVGNEAELIISGLDEPIKARVNLISPALDPGSTTVEIWVKPLKFDPALRAGTTVKTNMTAKSVLDATVVPTAAVFRNSEGADYVVLAGSDEKAHIKVVTVGIRTPDSVQIVSGIKPGDPVVVSGGYGIPDNTTIKVEEAAPAEKESGDKADKSDKPDKKDEPASGKDSAGGGAKEKD
jgi:HlyD family secretion protein